MAYVPLDTRPANRLSRLLLGYGRRKYGDLQPTRAAAHHAGVLLAMGAVEAIAGRGWDEARSPPALARRSGGSV